MIIDFHTHIAYHKLYSDQFLSSVFSNNNKAYTKKAVSVVKLFLQDKNCIQLIKQMDEAQIEKAVLLIVDDNNYFGDTTFSVEENYELHNKILKTYPDRFIVFAGFHPNREKGFDLLRKGIEKFEFKGVKLYPSYGFNLADHRLEICYQYCNKFKLPVLIHTGFSIEGLENQNAKPDLLEKVADQYSNIRFIMGHAGFRLDSEVIQNLLDKKNVYADISGFQTIIGSNEGKEVLRMIFKDRYNKKILFGSDWPITNLMKPLILQINTIKELDEDSESKEAIDNIFRNNALNILN